MLDLSLEGNPWIPNGTSGLCSLDMKRIEQVSASLRALLENVCPELVGAAESFSSHARYIPVSATGHSPIPYAEDSQKVGFMPKNINPIWAVVPALYLFARWGWIGQRV